MKKHIKGILISLMTLSFMIPAATVASANAINDPYVYVNTTNTTNTNQTQNTTSMPIVNPVAKFEDAEIYAEDIEIYVGDDFDIMNDVYAYDNGGNGEELTDEVTVSGEVNTAQPGEYDIFYEVTGANGQTVYADIIVTVIDPDEEEPEYDDGSYKGNARKCEPEAIGGCAAAKPSASISARPSTSSYTGGAQKCTPGIGACK